MKVEELAKKIHDLELKFDGLDRAMTMFQDNINNNIYWFYSAVGVMVAFIGAVGVALYFLVKSAVNAGVEKGISDVTSAVQKEISEIRTELQELKSNLDEHIIQLIKNNAKIRWAKGTVHNANKDFVFVSGLNGTIDWDSPITNVSAYDLANKKPVLFEFIDKGDSNFAFKLNSDVTLKNIEWIIIWYDKN